MPQWTQFQTGLLTCMRNTSRSERNQLCVPTPHQTVCFNVCICMYVAMCDIIDSVDYSLLCHKNKNSSATQQPPLKCTRSSLSKRPNSKRGYANQASFNQTHDPSTHRSSHCHQPGATPSRSTTSDSLPLTQLPIPLPSDSVQPWGHLFLTRC